MSSLNEHLHGLYKDRAKNTKPNTHGGSRKGSGRKSKTPTATISFRVSKDKQEELKSLVSAYIASLTL